MGYEEYKRKALEPIVSYIESAMASYSKEELEARIKEALPKKESEDERIRKFLVKHVSEWIGCIEHDLKISSKDVESEEELAMFKACLAYLERQKEQQPAEWSEEDERILTGIIERGSSQVPFGEPALRGEQMEWLMNRLKSLRPQPHWRPSEEQMHYLLAVINEPNNAGSESCHLVLKGLYEQLKKL